MEKIKQTSLDQTGIAVIQLINGHKLIPLFSENPMEEANEITLQLPVPIAMIKHVFISNNMLDYKIEDCIRHFQIAFPKVLPEDMMEELVSGFPYTYGEYSGNETLQKYAYA